MSGSDSKLFQQSEGDPQEEIIAQIRETVTQGRVNLIANEGESDGSFEPPHSPPSDLDTTEETNIEIEEDTASEISVSEEPDSEPKSAKEPFAPAKMIDDETRDRIQNVMQGMVEDIADRPNPRTALGALIKETLNPILHEWVNKNLPEIVERVVREEVQKITQSYKK